MNRDENDFENRCQKIYCQLEPKISGCLYHYTNFQGLKGILTERKIRFTDYRFLNDPTELLYGKNMVYPELIKLCPDNDFLNRTKELFINFDQHLLTYIACFTDQINKLSLWRYYANNCTGFAIGFGESFYSTNSEPTNPMTDTVISRIIYGDSGKSIIGNFINAYKECTDQKKGSYKKLIRHLLSIIHSLKNNSFKDEHEIRLSVSEGSLKMDPKTNHPFYFDDKYRSFMPINKPEVPFVNGINGSKPFLTPHEFSKKDIKEIWVGSACEFIEARAAIRKILIENSYDPKQIEIKQCELPFKDV